MKKVNRNKILILLLISISFSLVTFSLYQSGKLEFLSKLLKKTEALPTSYQECDKKNPKKGNFDPAKLYIPFCNYFIEESNPLYQKCIAHDGIKTEEVCALCPGCGCIPAGCRLTYVNPNFVLPENFDECRKIFTHSSGSNIFENSGKEYCAIFLPKQGIFNKKVGEQFFNECLNKGGKIVSDVGGCELKFYKD